MLKSMSSEELMKLSRTQILSSRELRMTIQDLWLNASLFNATSTANSPRRQTFRDKLMARMLETETWLLKYLRERTDSETPTINLWFQEKSKTTSDSLTTTWWRETETWSLKSMPSSLTAMCSEDRTETWTSNWRDLFKQMSRSEQLLIEETECRTLEKEQIKKSLRVSMR